MRRKWLLGLFALGASLLAAEATLQLAGLIAHALVSRAGDRSGDAGAVTILCVGDSHTYGLPLPEEESYPAQLEAALGERHPGVRFEVVNLGIPSLNSAFVANRLERQLHQIRPQLVIVWVGINNLWNAAERQADAREDPWLPLRRSLMNLKLFRLASLAWFNATGHQYEREGRGGWFDGELPPSGRLPEGVSMPDPAPGLADDLNRIAQLTAGFDVPLLLVTYPLASSEPINRIIEQSAGRLGVGVVDTRAELLRARADGHTKHELIDTRSGPHPSALLYAYVVDSMLPVVTATLESWHGLRLDPAVDSP